MNKLVPLALLTLFSVVFVNAAAAPKKIGILVFDGVLTSDVTAPIEVFGAAAKRPWFSAYQVVVISATRAKEIRSEEGLRMVADQTIYDPVELDVLLVPSAYKMDPLLENKELIQFIARQNRSASWMASNCSGAFLLGEAGVLDGKNATTWAGGEKGLAAAYPKVKVQSDRNVVVDDRVITSNGGPVSYQAAFALLARLSSEAHAKEIATNIQFSRLASAFEH